MAIDPVYISLAGRARLPRARRRVAAAAGRSGGAPDAPAASTRVPYADVRQAKDAALRLSFSLFYDIDWLRSTARAGSFAAFASWEDWWLGDYALYCALRDRHGGLSWPDWPMPLRSRQPAALDDARESLQREILFHQYTQWLADEQWADAREALGDVAAVRRLARSWSAPTAPTSGRNQHLFRFDRTDGHAARCVQRHRAGLGPARLSLGRDGARRSPLAAPARAAHEPAVRRLSRRSSRRLLPHVLAAAGESDSAASIPPTKPIRSAQGERILQLFQATGVARHRRGSRAHPRLRPRLARATAACPATRCSAGSATGAARPARSSPPSQYPAVSVATTSTHDIEPIALWWDVATRGRAQRALAASRRRPGPPRRRRGVAVHRGRPASACCAPAYQAGSDPAAAADAGRLRLARSHQRPRRPSATTTGRGACPIAVEAHDDDADRVAGLVPPTRLRSRWRRASGRRCSPSNPSARRS